MNQKKRQNLLIVILIIVAIVAIVYWYSNYKKTSPGESKQQVAAGLSPIEEIIREIKLDFSILDDTLFESLESHGILPVTAGETGNPNPFLSY